jgi:Tfp pilus assembly protein PilN
MAEPNSLDFNSLEEQPQPQGISRTAIILWLVVIGSVVFFIPLNLIGTTVRGDVTRLEANLQPVQATLAVVGTPLPEVQGLLDDLTQAQESASKIEQAYLSLKAERVNWPAVMAAIGSYNPAQLSLTSLTYADNRVTLNGRAIDDSTVVDYARTLEESTLFSRVVIQSVRSAATPFASPTITGTTSPQTTLTPTDNITPTATPTPTPNPRDEYETDDFEYTDIILGQSQRHNFNPIYDVDKVKFLAKVGRFYRVFTFDLAPGVDTFLTVGVGGTVYTNDDARPQDLSSELIFHVPADQDVEAFVKVTNRGQYGPDMWYQIAVEEIVPTPTSTPTSTPEPTPTSTHVPTTTPTDTPIPVNTPTSTPDLRDAYEPDDTAPKPIAVGETQTHNFFPDGDVDKASFITKAERHYQVLTSDLALGVDTYIEVTMGDQRWENDDYDLPGTGNFASAVCFQASSDGTATVAVFNRGQQFGPDKRYNLSVSEAPALEVIPLTLSFGPAVEGGTDPPAQQINIASIGDSPLTWEAETSVNWLSINPSSGTAPSIMQASVDIGGLPLGNYEGHITISGTSLCTANTPRTVTVTLRIVAPNARVPGLASLKPGSALTAATDPLQAVSGGAGIPPFPSVSRYNRVSSVLSSEAVEFVIVLELKATSP